METHELLAFLDCKRHEVAEIRDAAYLDGWDDLLAELYRYTHEKVQEENAWQATAS